jgi:hypothetical protein
VTERRIPAEDIQTILAFGRSMIEHPVELVEGVREVLETLRARDHELWLITKGDLFDQESKIARSGLAPLFARIEILSEKDLVTYERLLARYGSIRTSSSGGEPCARCPAVLAAGGRLSMPYEITLEHETVMPEEEATYVSFESEDPVDMLIGLSGQESLPLDPRPQGSLQWRGYRSDFAPGRDACRRWSRRRRFRHRRLGEGPCSQRLSRGPHVSLAPSA